MCDRRIAAKLHGVFRGLREGCEGLGSAPAITKEQSATDLRSWLCGTFYNKKQELRTMVGLFKYTFRYLSSLTYDVKLPLGQSRSEDEWVFFASDQVLFCLNFSGASRKFFLASVYVLPLKWINFASINNVPRESLLLPQLKFSLENCFFPPQFYSCPGVSFCLPQSNYCLKCGLFVPHTS